MKTVLAIIATAALVTGGLYFGGALTPQAEGVIEASADAAESTASNAADAVAEAVDEAPSLTE